MKKLGIIVMMVAVALSGCNGGSTEQTRTTVSDQNILSGTRTPTSQTTTTNTNTDDEAAPPKNVSESNTDDNETISTNSGSGDDPNSGFSISR